MTERQISTPKLSALPFERVPEGIERRFDACGLPETPGDPYEELLARFEDQYVPFSGFWELTHKCNLDCVMCYNVPTSQSELSTDEGLGVLEQLAAAGTLSLTLTGGEILTRRDFFVLAQRARELGFALDLKTNGTLITPEVADRLAALNPVRVDISLLGATDATFDRVARSKDSLRRVLRGINLLRERHVRVHLNTLLMDLNVAERQQMAELAAELGAFYQQTFKISTADDGQDKSGQHQLSTQAMADLLQADNTPFLPPLRSPGSRTCSVGLSSFVISPYGDIFPCIELRMPAGNLRQQRFAEIWANGPIFQDLRTKHVYKNLPECRVCPINSYCEGRCAGLAWKEHGDLYGGHSLACQHAQARFEQLHPGQPAPQTPLQARLSSARTGAFKPTNGRTHPVPLVGI